MSKNLIEQLGTGFNCEVDSSAPGGHDCVPNQIGLGDFPTVAACIDAPNGCKKWECQSSAMKKPNRKINIKEATQYIISNLCVAVDDHTAPYTNPTDCNNNCTPDESWTCMGNNLCVDPGDGSGDYPTWQECMDDTECGDVESWDCDGQGNCTDPGDGSGQYTSLTACDNSCTPVDNYDCTNATGNVCGLVSYQTSHQTLSSCQADFPNGCQETCCDMWVCVNGGKFNKCCREISLCTLQGHSSPWSPGGFPWNLVESSSVPQKEFKKILTEAPWMCNMSWSSYFGIWLGLTKQECMDGPSWSGVGPAAGQPGCGPCSLTPHDIDKKFDLDISSQHKEDGVDKIKRWKKEGRIKPLNENFYKELIELVEDIHRTKNLLKG